MVFGLVPSLVLRAPARRPTTSRPASRGSSRDRAGLLPGPGRRRSRARLRAARRLGAARADRRRDDARAARRGAEERGPRGRAAVGRIQASGAWPAVGRAACDHPRSASAQQPGVISAGSTNILPMEHGWRNPFQPADQTFARPEDRPQVQYHSVSEGYFETMGATLVDGRAFTAARHARDARPWSSSTRRWRARFYPERSAVGREIVLDAGAGRPARRAT